MAEPAAKPRRRRRPRGPRQLKFTREGRVFVLTTLGVGAAAVNTGNNLLYLVLGFLLSLIVLSGILSEVVLRRIRVRRRLPARAFAGTPCLIELTLTNDKPRSPTYSVDVQDRAEDEPNERRCYFLKVSPGQTEVGAYRRTPRRRGRLVLQGYRVSTRYPFSLFEKSRLIDDRAELVVYPELLPGERPPRGQEGRGQESSTRRAGMGLEVSGLRDYRPGDEARSIHWRRTASLGRMVVRERERDAARRLSLLIDNARPSSADAAWDEAFERAISRAARVAADALDDGLSVECRARGSRSPLVLAGSPPDPVFRFLALLEPVDAANAPPLEPPDDSDVEHFEPTRGAA